MNIVALRKQRGAVCPRCRHPNYSMRPPVPGVTTKPEFVCSACGKAWNNGYDGGIYAELCTPSVTATVADGLGKTVIAGGRKYRFTADDEAWLDTFTISEVVSGGATGADSDGEFWAHSRGIPVTVFRADWNGHGKAAGHIRNRKMAEYADTVILFPGGAGTANMMETAHRLGKHVIVREERKGMEV